jgi:hypothetical protein
MSLMSWLPRAFKELLNHVPTLLFEVISWGALTKDITTLSTRLMTGSGSSEARDKLAGLLPQNISFSEEISNATLTDDQKPILGAAILELYFRQLNHPQAMFLDLRLNHFGIFSGQIKWNPSSLWGSFSPSFAIGLKELYQGFYTKDDLLFRKGLVASGLVQSSWDENDKLEMERLFKAHFGKAIDEAMDFKLSSFQDSFEKVFQFLMLKKVKLETDFLVLGVMLVTLYQSLESLGGKYEVAKIYHQAQRNLDQ